MADTELPGALPPRMQDEQRPDIDQRVGQTLKLRRQIVGLTQAELAHLCGVSGQQIHKYETGQSRMTSSRLVQMASILQMPVSFFFAGIEDYPDAPNDLFEMLSDPSCLEMMMALRTVSNSSERRRIVDLVRVIVDHEAQRLTRDRGSAAPVTYFSSPRKASS